MYNRIVSFSRALIEIKSVFVLFLFFCRFRCLTFAMGNSTSAKKAAAAPADEIGEEEFPYLSCLVDPEILDWRQGLSNEEILKISKEHANLPVEISPRLFLSDRKGAHNMERLKELGITHVLNVAGPSAKMETQTYENAGMVSLNLDADDEEGYPMLSQHLERCRAFYTDCKSTASGKLVIHCQAGINRSGVIVAAIHMLEERKNVLDAVKHIRRRRGNCYLWNESFQKQLIVLAKKNNLLGPKPENVSAEFEAFQASAEHRNKDKFSAEKIKSLF